MNKNNSDAGQNVGKPNPKIHPVVIYPVVHPSDTTDLEELYRLMEKLAQTPDIYERPITVMDRKTFYADEWNKQFTTFRNDVVAKYSTVLDAWCVDTCQMWYTGLGKAFESGAPADIYWLIPGDFNYGGLIGKEVLAKMPLLPQSLLKDGEDLCIGEITVDINSSKQLIDTYGTFALLYNWFPQEGQEIRKATQRPRSEFFAIRHNFLKEVLQQRWFAYEQTLVMLLQAFYTKRCVRCLPLGDISDLPQGKESLPAAIAQVERTERVLKQIWRDWNPSHKGWKDNYMALAIGSSRIRYAAINTLARLLG